MKITCLQKTLAALVIVLFFIFGGFAIGLAQSMPTVEFFLAAELDHALPGGPVQIDRDTLRFGLNSETGGLPSTYQGPFSETRVLHARPQTSVQALARANVQNRKVSLDILDSVLLI